MPQPQTSYCGGVAAPHQSVDIGALFLSPWNHSPIKRAFDLLLGSAFLVIAAPFMLLVGLAVRLTSPGPVFFRQLRVGKGGKEFLLLKFRTMYAGRPADEPRVTRAGDPRITAVGRILRQWKLDELPQFWNVVRGDMSFVGPRPDVAEYLDTLNERDRCILRLRPGLTGVATLRYRNEGQLLSKVGEQDINRYYCAEVLPQKVRLDLEYARNCGPLSDLSILLRTAAAILT